MKKLTLLFFLFLSSFSSFAVEYVLKISDGVFKADELPKAQKDTLQPGDSVYVNVRFYWTSYAPVNASEYAFPIYLNGSYFKDVSYPDLIKYKYSTEIYKVYFTIPSDSKGGINKIKIGSIEISFIVKSTGLIVTGISESFVNNEVLNTEYYNLSGQLVNKENATPGIYIAYLYNRNGLVSRKKVLL